MRIDLSCPVENRGTTIKTSTKTGEAYALFRLFNLDDRVITSLKLTVHVYDAYGNELGTIPALMDDLMALPHSQFAENKAVSLGDYPEAKHLSLDFEEITFDDGNIYEASEDNIVDVSIVEPDLEEQARLKSCAGDDAVCFAQDPGLYWLCICGRANQNEKETCVRCGRDKATVLHKFGSHDDLMRSLGEKTVEDARLAEEERIRLEKIKAEKRKKAKKYTIIGLICAAALAVLIVLGVLVFRLIVTVMGNSAANNGDLVRAYNLYQMGHSSKIGEVSEQIRGNTAANAVQQGLFVADEENLYFVDNGFNIIRENKATGERVKLGDKTGYLLNLYNDRIYFVDMEEGYLHSMKTDGTDMQDYLENPVSYFEMVGDNMYFIMMEADPDLTAEQQQMLAMQGQPTGNYYLYTMKVGDTSPKRLSNENISFFSVYKGKIYFTKLEDDTRSLYVMNLNGGGEKKLLDGYLYQFVLANDKIYYVKNYDVNDDTQAEDYKLQCVDLNGEYNEILVEDTLVLSFNISEGSDLYYSGIEREAYENEQQQISGFYRKSAESGEVQQVSNNMMNYLNICGDDVVYYYSMEGLVKMKTDGSNVELLEATTTQTSSDSEGSGDGTAAAEDSAAAEDNIAAEESADAATEAPAA